MIDDSLSTKAINAALNQDWQAASKINLEIIKEEPDNLDALSRLGRSFIELGDLKKATAFFNKVLKIDRYNQIALKNLERISQLDKRKKVSVPNGRRQRVYCDFIEEPGKTKIVNLVNIATPKTLSSIGPSNPIFLKIRRHTVVVCAGDENESYVGSLPDDLGHRLVILIREGNTYEAFIKSCGKSFVTVFLREMLRGKKTKTIGSFSATGDRLPHSSDEEPVEQANYKAIKTGDNEPGEEEDDIAKTIHKLNDDEEPEKPEA